MRFRYLWIGILLVVTLLAAGCGAKPTPAPTPKPTATPAPTKTAVPPTATSAPTTVPTTATTTGPLPGLGEEVRNEEGGFAFRPIMGYTVETLGRDVFMTAPGENPELGPYFILSNSVLEGTATLDEAYEKAMADMDSNVQMSPPRDIRVAGAPAWSVELTAVEEGRQMAARVVVVKASPTQGVAIFGAATTDLWESQGKALMEALLASIRLFEPAVVVQPTAGPTPGGGLTLIRQWATSAEASSNYGETGWSAIQATGAPDTPTCGDEYTSWASAESDGKDWIELTYAIPVVPTQVNVVQNYNPSQVVKVELVDLNGDYHEIYTGQPERFDQCPYTLSIPVTADFQAIRVRVSVDQSELQDWNEIDAVELVGMGQGGAGPAETPVTTGEVLWRIGGQTGAGEGEFATLGGMDSDAEGSF